MRDKRWLEVSKFDGVPFQLFFVSFSSDSSSLLLSLLLIKVWNPHVMDTDEWRDLEFLIWFLQIGCPMGWWLCLHFLVAASEGRTLWHHLPGGLLPALACEGYMAGSWTELIPCYHTWLENLEMSAVWTSSLSFPTSFLVTFCLLHFQVEQ